MSSRLPLALVCLLGISTASTQAVSIGFNMVNGNSETSITNTSLAPSAVVGYVSQANWNNTIFFPAGDGNGSGSFTDGLDSSGAATTADINVTFLPGFKAYPSTGATWGWSGDELTFHTGAVNADIQVTLTQIPYSMYDVYVYMAAGNNGGNAAADVSLSLAGGASGTVNPTDYYFQGYNGTNYVQVTSTNPAARGNGNYFHFSGNTADGLVISFNASNALFDTMIAGIQIVQVPEPGVLPILGLGAGLLLFARRRRQV